MVNQISPENKGRHLFEGYGIELEYMIVDRITGDVVPVADRLLKQGDRYESEVDRGALAWSNELALHVIELKTNGPADSLAGLHTLFQHEVREINRRLEPLGARLLPSAMHPWMNPDREMQLWPHEYNPVYEAYNRIFDCRGHGWANLQSMHINLPFAGDEEFGKLHAAIRVLLPILPALAASSPIAEMKIQLQADFRLQVYQGNAAKIPSITGSVIPEPVFTQADYERVIFRQMYDDIGPYDPGDILQEEWLNSRGAIARFDRSSIEIRVLDIQECPLADLALARIITDTLQALVEERWMSLEAQKSWSTDELYGILTKTIAAGEKATPDDPDYAALFGMENPSPEFTAGQLWRHLFDLLYKKDEIAGDEVLQALNTIIEKGTLSTRIKKALGDHTESEKIKKVYRQLAKCLDRGRLFTGD